jgi:hypothetical protein
VDDPDDGEKGNTNDNRSENEYGVHGTLLWHNGGEMVFGKQVARIIAVADNHYPGFMHNEKQMDNALQLAVQLS